MDGPLPLYAEVAARLAAAGAPIAARHRLHGHDTPTEEFPAVTSSDLEKVQVYEPTSPLLKRHVVHDQRSRAYALTNRGVPTKRIVWPRVGPIFDQNTYNNGQGLGCCTACAGYGLLMTQPFDRGTRFTDQQVQDLYHLETTLDDREIPGVWPPSDTGSAGLYLMKALKRQGHITGYKHAFSIKAALSALTVGPVAVGTVWLESMNDPYNGTLHVDPRSTVEGGHEYCIRGFDPRGRGWVLMQNSWGTGWGINVSGAGSAWIDLPSFAWLLSQSGDVVQPTVTP